MRSLIVIALVLLAAGCRQAPTDTAKGESGASEAAVAAVAEPALEQADCESKLYPQLFASGEAVLLHAKKTPMGCDMDVDFLKQTAEEAKPALVAKFASMGYSVDSEQPARRGVRVVLRSGTKMVSVLIRSKDAVTVTTPEAQGTAYIHWYHEQPGKK